MGKLFSPSKPKDSREPLLHIASPQADAKQGKLSADAFFQGGADCGENTGGLDRKKQIFKQTFPSAQTQQKLNSNTGGGVLRQKKIFELLNSRPAPCGFKLTSLGMRQTRLNFENAALLSKPSTGSLTTASHLSPRSTADSFSFDHPFDSSPKQPPFFDPEFNERFRVGKVLGQGAFATVRECECRLTGRRAAVKSYHHSLQGGVLDHVVQNEIRVLRAAKHPNIIELLGVVRTRSTTHIILELFEGETLEQRLEKSSARLPPQECRQVFRQVLAAVLYLHQHQLYHRDLKIENIMINEECQVKIIDFGFALNVAQPGLPPLVCGTPNYMAPEVVKAAPTEPSAAEVWSLGVLVHRLHCGNFPFRPESPHESGSRLIYQYQRPADVPDSLHNLLTSIFEADVGRRLTLDRVAGHAWLVNADSQ